MLDLNFDLIILEEKEKIEPEQYEIKPEDIAALIYTSEQPAVLRNNAKPSCIA